MGQKQKSFGLKNVVNLFWYKVEIYFGKILWLQAARQVGRHAEGFNTRKDKNFQMYGVLC